MSHFCRVLGLYLNNTQSIVGPHIGGDKSVYNPDINDGITCQLFKRGDVKDSLVVSRIYPNMTKAALEELRRMMEYFSECCPHIYELIVYFVDIRLTTEKYERMDIMDECTVYPNQWLVFSAETCITCSERDCDYCYMFRSVDVVCKNPHLDVDVVSRKCLYSEVNGIKTSTLFISFEQMKQLCEDPDFISTFDYVEDDDEYILTAFGDLFKENFPRLW